MTRDPDMAMVMAIERWKDGGVMMRRIVNAIVLTVIFVLAAIVYEALTGFSFERAILVVILLALLMGAGGDDFWRERRP